MPRTRDVGLFGTQTRTRTLLAIHVLGEVNASEIAATLGRSTSRIWDAIDSLEKIGVVVGRFVGNTRPISLNPDYPAVEELRNLLTRLVEAEPELRDRLKRREANRT